MLQGLEAGATHSERIIELLLHEDIDRLSADMLHHVGKQYKSQIAIQIAFFLLQFAVSDLVKQIHSV